MSEWILGCNSKYFDIKKAFSLEQTITWRQDISVETGDIIYFYIPNPYRAILYKCEVIQTSLQNMDKNSRQYVLKPQYHNGVEKYMMLKLVRSYPDTLFTDKELKKFGVTSFQTAINVDARLANYLHKEGKNSMPFSKYFILISMAAIVFVLGIGFYVAFGRKDDNKDTKDEKSIFIERSEESNHESSIIEPEGLVSSNVGQGAEISTVESEIISDPEELVSEVRSNLMDNISAVPYSWNPNAGESFHKSTGKNRLRSWNNEKYGGLIQLYPNEIYKLSIKSSEEMDFNIGYILFSTEDGTDDVPDGLPYSSGWIYIDNNKDMYEFTINTSEKNYYLGINLANQDRSELTETEIACLKEVLKNIYLEKEE